MTGARRPSAGTRLIELRNYFSTLPPLATQSFSVGVITKPFPLHAFCPLQLLDAPLQAL